MARGGYLRIPPTGELSSPVGSQQLQLRKALGRSVDELGYRDFQLGVARTRFTVGLEGRLLAHGSKEPRDQGIAVTGAVEQWEQVAVERPAYQVDRLVTASTATAR